MWVISYFYCIFAVTSELFRCNFLLFSCGLFFSTQRRSFSICRKAGLVVLNSFSFFLPVKLLIYSSNVSENLAGQSILGCRFFSFITFSLLCHSFLACRVLVEKSVDSLTGIPCVLSVVFPLLLSIFSLKMLS